MLNQTGHLLIKLPHYIWSLSSPRNGTPDCHRHWLWEGLWRRRRGYPLESACPLLYPQEDHLNAGTRERFAELCIEDNFRITPRSRLESVRDVCCRFSSSSLWSTGSWELLQKEDGMAYSGRFSHNLMILSFDDDLALLSLGHALMQDNTIYLDSTSSEIGPLINNGKTKIMRKQHARNSRVTTAGQPWRSQLFFRFRKRSRHKGWDRCRCEG